MVVARDPKPQDLIENSVLFGTAQQITNTLTKVQAASFSEAISI
jgi:hypothetical protein